MVVFNGCLARVGAFFAALFPRENSKNVRMADLSDHIDLSESQVGRGSVLRLQKSLLFILGRRFSLFGEFFPQFGSKRDSTTTR